jgi:hypothetical protein
MYSDNKKQHGFMNKIEYIEPNVQHSKSTGQQDKKINTQINIYKAMVVPILTYGSEICT